MKTPHLCKLGLFISLILSLATYAAPAQFSQDAGSEIEKVKLSKTLTLQTAPSEKPTSLQSVAQGLRRKKVTLLWFKVYVAQIFSSSEKLVDRTSLETFHDSLSQNSNIAVTLSFLRNLSEKQILNAFQEQLEANGIDLKNESIQSFIHAIEKSGGNDEGKSMILAFHRGVDGKENISIESGNGHIENVTLSNGMIRKLLLIWLGKASDTGMTELQSQFLKK